MEVELAQLKEVPMQTAKSLEKLLSILWNNPKSETWETRSAFLTELVELNSKGYDCDRYWQEYKQYLQSVGDYHAHRV